MSRIQVGMMVRVVDHPEWSNSRMRWTIGKVSRVIGKHPKNPVDWQLDGLLKNRDGREMLFSEKILEPYRPDSEPSTWEEVESITGWCPRETVKQ